MSSMPGVTPPAHVYVQITNAEGKYDIVVEIHDLKEDHVIARGQGLGVEIKDRHAFCDVVIQIPGIPVRHEGKYDLVVIVNREAIDRQQFNVTKVHQQ